MTSDQNILPRFLQLQKSLISNLRLKDVLDQSLILLTEMSAGAKVAIYFADHQSNLFRLMAAKGYSEGTLNDAKLIPYSTESLLKYLYQKKIVITATDHKQAPALSSTIMQKEGSQGQIAIPLVSAGNMIGACLMDVNNANVLSFAEFLREMADVCAVAISNAVAYGRSEYERERLNMLYKSTCALNQSSLEINQVLQIAADTALVLGNTPSCAVLLLEPDADEFQLAAFKGLDGESLKEFNMSARKSIAGSCLRSGMTETYGDGSREPFGMPRAMGGSIFASCVAFPLIWQDRKIGVLEVFSTEEKSFQKENIELLESLASQVAASLNTALAHETVASQTINDAHTGLANRVYFQHALSKEVDRCLRHSHDLSILMVDIDHLSQINEMLGQARGDEAIKHVAAIIKETLREIDIPARYGGEEFAVLLPETNRNNAYEVAQRLREKIKAKPAPGIGLITVSIGIAACPANHDTADKTLEEAEKALNIAKYKGRDRVVSADPEKFTDPDSISWDRLAADARLAVIAERQNRMQSRLTAAPEYATWMAKPATLTAKKKSAPVDF